MISNLTFDNIALEIDGVKILKGVSANLKAGEIVGLIGPNGAGKSSLLRAILGLIKISNGIVALDGADLKGIGLKERARLLSFAAQGSPLHWPLLVERLVSLGRVSHMDPWQRLSRHGEEQVEKALHDTDCLHLKGRVATSLSGGERARVLLARTIASEAPFLLADEPLASLDPLHQLQVMEILKSHAAQSGGVMVAMHDLDMAQRYCDRLILLNNGELVGQGTPTEILSDENLAKVFGVVATRWSDGGENYMATRHVVARNEVS
jgi:iron complex transport system ATP-binding protein